MFVGDMASVSMTQLSHGGAKVASNNRQEWAWLCPNNTLFMNTAIGISYHFLIL